MEVGPGFFLPSAISTQRLLFFCRFSKSKLKEMLTTGSMYLGKLSGSYTLRTAAWGSFIALRS